MLLGDNLGLGVKKKLVVFSAVVANGAHIQKDATVSDLENIDALEPNGKHSQKILMQKHTGIVGQVNVIIFENGAPSDGPISEPDDNKGYLFDARNARHGAVRGDSVGVRSSGCGKNAIQVVLRGQEEVLADNLIGASGKRNLVQQHEEALEPVKPRR